MIHTFGKNKRNEVVESTAIMTDFLVYMGVLGTDNLKEKYEHWVDAYTDNLLKKSVENSSDEDIKTADLFYSLFGNARL